MKITQFTTMAYLLSVGFAGAASPVAAQTQESPSKQVALASADDHGHAHGPNGEHAEDKAADDHGHGHGPNGEHLEHKADDAHVHGPDCNHGDKKATDDHGHAHGPNGEHLEHKAGDAHVHGPDCNHGDKKATDDHGHAHGPNSEHAEDKADDDHGHAHGPNGEHAEDKADDDHGHAHGPSCSHNTGNETITVNPHARDIIALKTQKAPKAQRNLVTSLHGFLDTPAHAYESYVLPSAGILDIKVRSAQLVKKGDILFTINAPAISELIAQQADAQASYDRLLADTQTIQTRLDALAKAGTRNSDLEEQLRFKKAEAAEQQLAMQNISTRLHSSAMGADIIRDGHHILLAIRAKKEGRISQIELNQGSWAQQGDKLLSMIDPRALEISASLYGNEQPQFSEAIATLPLGNKQVSVQGKLRVSDQVNPQTQTRQLYFVADELPHGAQAGLLCRIDLYQHADAQKGITIPNTAIIKVGVDDIVFVRRSESEFEAIKVSVLGTRRDMSTVTGIHAGDDVVVAGGYELKFLLGGGSVKQKQTGHFHADGKFHEGEDH